MCLEINILPAWWLLQSLCYQGENNPRQYPSVLYKVTHLLPTDRGRLLLSSSQDRSGFQLCWIQHPKWPNGAHSRTPVEKWLVCTALGCVKGGNVNVNIHAVVLIWLILSSFTFFFSISMKRLVFWFVHCNGMWQRNVDGCKEDELRLSRS